MRNAIVRVFDIINLLNYRIACPLFELGVVNLWIFTQAGVQFAVVDPFCYFFDGIDANIANILCLCSIGVFRIYVFANEVPVRFAAIACLRYRSNLI